MLHLLSHVLLPIRLLLASFISADCFLPNGKADWTYNECLSPSLGMDTICCSGWDACLTNNVCGHINYTDFDAKTGQIVSYYRGTCANHWEPGKCANFCLGLGYPENPDDLMGDRATWVMGKCPAMDGDGGKERWYCMTDEEGGDKKSYGTEDDCTKAAFGFESTQTDGRTGTESAYWTVFQEGDTVHHTKPTGAWEPSSATSAEVVGTTRGDGGTETAVTVITASAPSSGSTTTLAVYTSTSTATSTVLVTVWPSDGSSPTSWTTIQQPPDTRAAGDPVSGKFVHRWF
jgi:hypothetical protein